MFNPRPGPIRDGMSCEEHPELPVHEPPIGSGDVDHAHVNQHGITFACDSDTTEDNDG